MNVIEVKSFYKGYRLYRSKKDILLSMIPFMGKRYSVKWALKKVNFSVKKGESVALLGINGSGKSTLLQSIAGIVQSTSGSIVTKGRIAALLELGVGFNPELTGRQNIFLTASLWGYPEKLIRDKAPEIIAFAEIGEYIDQAVKSYSSGMYVRLAFSVAIHVEPDILLVDEALSVGDSYFQSKCFRKLEDLKKNGVTLLYVSHDIATVRQVCERAILLHKGRLIKDGVANPVTDMYNTLLMTKNLGKRTLSASDESAHFQTVEFGSGDYAIKNYSISTSGKKSKWQPWGGNNKILSYIFTSGRRIKISFLVENFSSKKEKITVSFIIKDSRGLDLVGSSSFLQKKIVSPLPGKSLEVIFLADLNIASGEYYLTSIVHMGESGYDNCFQVVEYGAVISVSEPIRKEFGKVRGNCSVEVRPSMWRNKARA